MPAHARSGRNEKMRRILTAVALLSCISSSQVWAAESPTCPGRNRALVTAGGGIRGAYQAGAAWYLVNVLRCDFHKFVGTSTGALTAATLAQSSSFDELVKNTERLVDSYRRMKSKEDIVEEHPLGALRLILPPWLGGIDGLHSFRPLIERLDKEIDFNKIPSGRLVVTVVSLQAGRLEGDRLLSLRDQVIGSASIPVAVEPRVARVWTTAYVSRIGDGVVSLISTHAPGLADDQCEIEIWQKRLRCEMLSTRMEDDLGRSPEHLQFTPIHPRWAVELRVARDELGDFLPKVDEARSLARFTTKHQIVDGGVVENIPILTALSNSTASSVDTIFVLGTGLSAETDTNFDHHGALEVAAASFERLWDEYQYNSLGLHAAGLEISSLAYRARKALRKMDDWRNAVEARLSPDAVTALRREFPMNEELALRDLLKDLEPLTGPDKEGPRIFFILPSRTPFTGGFDVHPEKIRLAMYDGCVRAASKRFDHRTDLSYALGTDTWASTICHAKFSP